MLNDACKYRECRDTKGAVKRSGVRSEKEKGRVGAGGYVRGWFIVCRVRIARGVCFTKGGPERS